MERIEEHPMVHPGGKNEHENEHGMLDGDCVPDVPEAVLGPRGTARFLVNGQGIRLACYHWPVVPTLGHQALRGVVVLVHGYAVHLTFSFLQSLELDPPKPYDGSWIHRMNLAGYAVWGIDNQSCGRSEGVRSDARMYFERFEDLCSDVEQLIQVIKDHPLYVNLPLFMIGESMGGNISVHVSQKLHRMGIVDGTILLAPMISLEKLAASPLNRVMLPIARALCRIAPATRIPMSKLENKRNAYLQQQFERDPMNQQGSASVQVAILTIEQCRRTVEMLDQVDFPFFVLHSQHDEIVDPEGSHMLYERAASRIKKLSVLDHPKSFHLLAGEPMHLEVLSAIFDWLEHRLVERVSPRSPTPGVPLPGISTPFSTPGEDLPS
eukprot:scaffold776_cov347-Pavlova_lutheri.AAC.57